MELLWYDPDLERYQLGSIELLRKRMLRSQNSNRFEVLFEFEGPGIISEKVLSNLNVANAAYSMN